MIIYYSINVHSRMDAWKRFRRWKCYSDMHRCKSNGWQCGLWRRHSRYKHSYGHKQI